MRKTTSASVANIFCIKGFAKHRR